MTAFVRSMACVALLAGCVKSPQTRYEFVSMVIADTSGSERETFVVERGLDDVLATLSRMSDACLARGSEYTAMSGGVIETVHTEMNPSIERIGADRAEMTVQFYNGDSSAPPGGFYVIAEDLTRDGTGTRVDYYYATYGFDDVVDAIRAWTRGEDAECPDIPGQ